MSRVFITGSADGLGRIVARQLIGEGHEVVLHARSESRGRDALDGAPGAAGVLTAGCPTPSSPAGWRRRWAAPTPAGPLRRCGRAHSGAPDDLRLGGDTQAWLAVSADAEAQVSGELFDRRAVKDAHPAASEPAVQDALLGACRQLSGVDLGV